MSGPYLMTHYVSTTISASQDDLRTSDGSDGIYSNVFPNWARWTSSLNANAIGAGGEIVPINTGEGNGWGHAVIDLSSALSFALGQQLDQTQTYRVSSVRIALENDASGVNNEASTHFTGRLEWFNPTQHRVDAVQTYRDAHKEYYSASGSNSLFFDDEATNPFEGLYRGLRFGLRDNAGTLTGSSDQVPYQTEDPFTDVGGTQANLISVFDAYDEAMPGAKLDVDTYLNGLWRANRTGHPNVLGWEASIRNWSHDDKQMHTAGNDAFQMGPGMDMDVMCGLLLLTIDSTAIGGNLNLMDGLTLDEFHIRVTFGIDSWGGGF